MSFDFEPISNRKEVQNMKSIHSFMSFVEYLQTIVKTFAQRDYQQLHQKLCFRYEQLLMDAFLKHHPSWSIVHDETACAMFLYRNWIFSKDQLENARQIAALAEDLAHNYSDADENPISPETAETVMYVVERIYRFSDCVWRERHMLIFLLPALHKTEDAFCRCYQKSNGTVEADVYLPVTHEDFSATPQSILLHEIGHIINLALTGTMEVQPDDFEVVSALLHLNLDGVDCKEFFAHCFAMSLLIEPELTQADPFTMVSEMDKRLFQTYFRHILENRCVTC